MVINGIEWWLMVIFMVIFMVIDNHYRNHTKRYTYLYITYLSGWCFGTWLWLFHWLGIIILPDFHMFQRGRYTTNQNVMKYSITCIDMFSISDEEPFGCSLVTVMLKWTSRNMLEASIRLDYQLCGLSTRLPFARCDLPATVGESEPFRCRDTERRVAGGTGGGL